MNTSTDAVSSTAYAAAASASTASAVKSSAASSFSMDDFLKILSAELQYQDPLSDSSSGGSSNSEYVTQMVECNLLLQVQSLVTQSRIASAPSAIGQTVLYATRDADDNVAYHQGTVSAVELSGDTPSYLVDGVWVDQSGISGFYKAAPADSGSDSDSAAQGA